MSKNRPGTPSLSVQLECLFKRFPILCRECGERLLWDDERAWDHVIEFADMHDNSAENYAPVHPLPCHRVKSAKAEAQRHHIDRLENVKNGKPKRARDKYKKKIRSAGFDKRHRPLIHATR